MNLAEVMMARLARSEEEHQEIVFAILKERYLAYWEAYEDDVRIQVRDEEQESEAG